MKCIRFVYKHSSDDFTTIKYIDSVDVIEINNNEIYFKIRTLNGFDTFSIMKKSIISVKIMENENEISDSIMVDIKNDSVIIEKKQIIDNSLVQKNDIKIDDNTTLDNQNIQINEFTTFVCKNYKQTKTRKMSKDIRIQFILDILKNATMLILKDKYGKYYNCKDNNSLCSTIRKVQDAIKHQFSTWLKYKDNIKTL